MRMKLLHCFVVLYGPTQIYASSFAGIDLNHHKGQVRHRMETLHPMNVTATKICPDLPLNGLPPAVATEQLQ